MYFLSPSNVTLTVFSPTGKSRSTSSSGTPLTILTAFPGSSPLVETYTVPFSPSPVTGSTKLTSRVVFPFVVFVISAVICDSLGILSNASMLNV